MSSRSAIQEAERLHPDLHRAAARFRPPACHPGERLPISLLHLALRLDKSTLTPPDPQITNTQKEMKLKLIDRDFWLLAATAALIGAGGSERNAFVTGMYTTITTS